MKISTFLLCLGAMCLPVPTFGQMGVPPAAFSQIDAGARVFAQQCRSCHTLKTGERNSVGPNLAGFLGKRAGTANTSFRYSSALKASQIVWNETTLSQFLKSPSQTIPRTSMVFRGVSQDASRLALIEYLKREAK